MVYHQKDSLAQNFIKYPRLVTELLSEAELTLKDTVIEIGPGKGIITDQLYKKVGNVIGVEIDSILADNLRTKYCENEKITIITKDFLDYRLPETPYKVFSNIPFSKSAEIMSKFLGAKYMPEALYLIMQQEVAEKFLGIPIETMSSIMAKPFYEIEILGEIDRTNFLFKPQVHIVFVKFAKREIGFVKEELREEYGNFVRYGFTQWKMTLGEAFKKVFTHEQLGRLEKGLKIKGLKPSEVSLDTWLLLFKSYLKLVSITKRNIIYPDLTSIGGKCK